MKGAEDSPFFSGAISRLHAKSRMARAKGEGRNAQVSPHAPTKSIRAEPSAGLIRSIIPSLTFPAVSGSSDAASSEHPRIFIMRSSIFFLLSGDSA